MAGSCCQQSTTRTSQQSASPTSSHYDVNDTETCEKLTAPEPRGREVTSDDMDDAHVTTGEGREKQEAGIESDTEHPSNTANGEGVAANTPSAGTEPAGAGGEEELGDVEGEEMGPEARKTLRLFDALRRFFVLQNERRMSRQGGKKKSHHKLANTTEDETARADESDGGRKEEGGENKGEAVNGRDLRRRGRRAAKSPGSGQKGSLTSSVVHSKFKRGGGKAYAGKSEQVLDAVMGRGRQGDGGEKDWEYHRRPDLAAGKILREKRLVVNNDKSRLLGQHVAGVPVGAQFFSRQELCVVGVTLQAQGGIDFSPATSNQWGLSLASCIVLSGGYQDDCDNGNTFEYTGQGGNNYLGDRTQIKDQCLERGNLALVNSHKAGIPVRVVRGLPEPASYTRYVYTYDGLYRVASWKEVRGAAGHVVFKFEMERVLGQPPLSTQAVEFAFASLGRGTKAKDRSGVMAEDVSGGAEANPICVVNTVEHPSMRKGPPPFTYLRSMEYGTLVLKQPGEGQDGSQLHTRDVKRARVLMPPPSAAAGDGSACEENGLGLASDGTLVAEAAAASEVTGAVGRPRQQLPVLVPPLPGCSCVDGCRDPSVCLCAQRNGGSFPYTKEGGLVWTRNAVFECGPGCGCACKGPATPQQCNDTINGGASSLCGNRVTQRGTRARLEVFRTRKKGWGVRSWDAIPAGHFVCEYTGALMSDDEAEGLRGQDEYLFDLDLSRGIVERWGCTAAMLGEGGGGEDEEECWKKEMRAWNKAWQARIEEERRKREGVEEGRAGSQVGEKKQEEGSEDGAGVGNGACEGSTEVMVGRPGSDSSPLPLGCCDATRRRLRVEAQATGAATTTNTITDVSESDGSNPHYCLDAKKVGSVARFINHSCSPNLFVQCVFHDHGDERFPHVMLFAYDNIPPLKELTYDYGYVIGSVRDAEGREKKLECHCGSAKCRGRLY